MTGLDISLHRKSEKCKLKHRFRVHK